jgi:hypothetical protein
MPPLFYNIAACTGTGVVIQILGPSGFTPFSYTVGTGSNNTLSETFPLVGVYTITSTYTNILKNVTYIAPFNVRV